MNAGDRSTNWRLDSYIETEEALADYFVSGHQERYGTEPDYAAALAYDTLTAVTMELRDSDAPEDDPLAHLRGTTHYGVAGVVKFR